MTTILRMPVSERRIDRAPLFGPHMWAACDSSMTHILSGHRNELEGRGMLRRIMIGGLAATLALVVLAGCGGPETSPSAAAASPADSPAATTAPVATVAPTVAPEPTPVARVTMLAICAGVAVRTGPTMTDEVLVRAVKLTKVRVDGTVTGDPYEASACGTSGADWIKIARINGSSVKKLYGVKYAYSAAGFWQ